MNLGLTDKASRIKGTSFARFPAAKVKFEWLKKAMGIIWPTQLLPRDAAHHLVTGIL